MTDETSMTGPVNALIWVEIPVTDMARAKAFYGAILEAALIDEEGGPNEMAMLPYAGGSGVSGHLYPGRPAAEGTGTTAHLPAPGTIEAIAERVLDAGGQIVGEPLRLPSRTFVYALDPDGNSIALHQRWT